MQVISTKDETIRLFKSDFCEFFTRVHWSLPLIVYFPVIVWALVQAYAGVGAKLALGWAAGLLAWTLLEYALHRWVFHFEGKGRIAKRIIYLFHGIHHAYPSDSWRLVMPPAVSLPLAVGFYFLCRGVAGENWGLALFAGLVSGYLVYDLTHYAVHHAKWRSRGFRFLKAYHLKHHFSEPERGYGVSSPLWDHIFRTTLNEKPRASHPSAP